MGGLSEENRAQAWRFWALILSVAYEVGLLFFVIAPQLFGWWESVDGMNPSAVFWTFLVALALHGAIFAWQTLTGRFRRSQTWHHGLGVLLWAGPFIGVAWWGGEPTGFLLAPHTGAGSPVLAPLLPEGGGINNAESVAFGLALTRYVLWKGILTGGAIAAMASITSANAHVREMWSHARIRAKKI